MGKVHEMSIEGTKQLCALLNIEEGILKPLSVASDLVCLDLRGGR